MVRVKKCDICSKPARGGQQIGTFYACPECIALAEQSTWEAPPEQRPLINPPPPELAGEDWQRNTIDPPRPSAFSNKLKQSQGDAPHVIVEARAGTGKTTTLIEGLKYMRGLGVSIEPSPQQAAVWEQLLFSHDAKSVCFVAFNKSIATELQRRVPPGCEAMTMHSMGYKAVRQYLGNVKVNQYRVQDIIQEVTGRDIRELRKTKLEVIKAVEDLVGLCKMNLVGTDQEIFEFFRNRPYGRDTYWSERLADLASYYDIDLNGCSREVFDLVPKVLERCKDVMRDRCVDFDDMIWLPVVLNLPVTKYDVLLVDEAQDLNRCQQALAMMAGRRLILCGDPKQAIYGFAGADAESMKRMQAALEATERGCVHLPLTVTRRCGKAIVAEAQKIVPDFGYWETNPEGRISQAIYETESDGTTYHKMVEDGNMILCRVNAPLVSQCFRFLKAGRKAQIQGRDVGQGLISTVKKQKATDIADLSAKLSDWLHIEAMKETAKRNPNENKLIALQDRVDCLFCFMEGQATVEGVIAKIESVFTDDKSSPGIKLSSIHKAKGLEAGQVFLLMPEGAGLPHPMAKSRWAREQEMNLKYVAITRAIHSLVYVV